MRKFGQMWPTLKRLLAYGSPWRKPLSIAVLLLWIAAIAEVTGPLLISYFIDNMVAKSYLPLGPGRRAGRGVRRATADGGRAALRAVTAL